MQRLAVDGQLQAHQHRDLWQPRWDYVTTIARTVGWYQAMHEWVSTLKRCKVSITLCYETSLVESAKS